MTDTDLMNNDKFVLELIEKSEKVKQILDDSKKIIITTHINPDGDAIGSALALYHFLLSIDKDVWIINYSETPKLYAFLEGSENILHFTLMEHGKLIESADIIFILDLNDLSRLREMASIIESSQAKIVLIDHHLEPKSFADIEIIDTDASSTGEIIFKLISSFQGNKISKQISESLYTAIMTDSGNFRFQRTDAALFRIAAHLIDCGADPVMLYDRIYNTVSFAAMALLGEAMANAKLLFNDRVNLFVITREMFSRTGAIEADVENFAEKTLMVDGVEVGILITQLPDRDELRCSLRSKANISVREIASKFSGGGHFHAAGLRIYSGNLEENIKKILTEVEKAVINF
ncbi:MAG: bifunctional oligoribonuclease/PAP phosphatase NrnA [Candidatus Kapabacteria bacterium]|nr:bifunctional oligoribonuclease/PAP phosphatase NrnA [Candidatus Kapabacteria bacterium]